MWWIWIKYKLGLKLESSERRESFINMFGEYYYQDNSTTLESESDEFQRKRYLYFSEYMHSIFISKYGYIVDIGNYETVNFEMMYEIEEKIKKHPIIWKLFFMIA